MHVCIHTRVCEAAHPFDHDSQHLVFIVAFDGVLPPGGPHACIESVAFLCFFHLQVVLVPFLEALGGRAISRNVWTATALASVGRNHVTLSFFLKEDTKGA